MKKLNDYSFSAIILMAGDSTRFHQNINKNLYSLNKTPIFFYSLKTFYNLDLIKDIYLVLKDDDLEEVKEIINTNNIQDKVTFVIGGSSRNQSVQNALKLISTDYCLIHDGARPLVSTTDIYSLINETINYSCGSLYHEITDTIKLWENKEKNEITTINRNNLVAMSTPQIFSKHVYDIILNNTDETITDELMLLEDTYPIKLVKETSPNTKITSLMDYEYVKFLINQKEEYKIGHSFDYHNFSNTGPLILGGVIIDSPYGLDGWSDADVVYHAVCEAMLGALGLGDIGTLFPDNDPINKGRNSVDFVNTAMTKVIDAGYSVQNIDIIIYLEKPNLKNYKSIMGRNIQKLLSCDYINVKATTLEKQGLVGNKKGIACEAVVLLKQIK